MVTSSPAAFLPRFGLEGSYVFRGGLLREEAEVVQWRLPERLEGFRPRVVEHHG